jgi:hypothetical protein
MEKLEHFLEQLQDSFEKDCFNKITLSKPLPQNDLLNVYARPVVIKGRQLLSFTYRYKTKDETKNYNQAAAIAELSRLMQAHFKIATLFTSNFDLSYQITKKGKESLFRKKPSSIKEVSTQHDRQKKQRVNQSALYMKLLGITDASGQVIPRMADKYRQINKYLEIIEGLVKATPLPKEIKVVDMGSGKGYLTFALYDFLNNYLQQPAHVTGIELRKELVEQGNGIRDRCGFDDLNFECGSIGDFKDTNVDILIALHACDTATDDAIASGIIADATLIITAPCCHKQIRQQVKGKKQTSPLLQYGIFKERQFEMVTDTIRALIMEGRQYETKIFEFVSNEHTRKNIMMVGAKTSKKVDSKTISAKIVELKDEYGIDYHYLEKVVK